MKKKKVVKTFMGKTIKRRYLLPTGFNKYRWVTVYSDYSVDIGGEQNLSEKQAFEIIP